MKFDNTVFPEYDQAKAPAMSEREAKEKAFYYSSLSNLDTASDTFNQTYDEFIQTGDSQAYRNAEATYQAEEDETKKLIISNLMGDPTIPADKKKQALRMYSLGGYIPKTLKDKYIESIALLELGKNNFDREHQEQVVDSLPEKLDKSKSDSVMENTPYLKSLDEKYGKPVAAEAGSLIGNLFVGTVKGIAEYGYKVERLFLDLLNGYDVDVEGYKKEFEENYSKSKVLDYFNELDPKFLAKWLGVEKEFEEAYTTQALNWVGDQFTFIAEKAAEKGVAKDKETALFAMETAGFLVPFAWKGATVVKNKLKHPSDSPIDNTISANPQLAEESLAATLIDEDGAQLADALGTTQEAVIAENVLPNFGTEPQANRVMPDINRRLEQRKTMSERDQLLYDALFDDNIINSESRMLDFERRLNVAQGTRLYHNIANSTFVMTDKILEGNMVFTQGPNKGFSSKRLVNNAIKQLQPIINTFDEADRGSIKVRDLKTNKLYTAEAFLKSRLEKGEFQLEYDFKKKYEILDNPAIEDTRLDEEEFTMFGLPTGGYKNSVLSEYFSGQNFYPRWVEIARNSVGDRAQNFVSRLTSKMDNLVKANKDINPYMGKVAIAMEKQKVDLFSPSELANFEVDGIRLGDKLSQKQLRNLDEMQKEWRNVQDTLFELTNQGEKTRLINEGYNKGIYINNRPTLVFAKELDRIISDIPEEVLDIDTGKIVKYVPDPSKKNVYNLKDPNVDVAAGKKLVRLHKKQYDNTGASSDYALISAKGKSELKILPQRVINKIDGHFYRQYESHFFIPVKPVYIRHNGIEYGRGTTRPVPDEFIEMRGTSTTRFEADQLVQELRDPDSPNYIPDVEVLEPVRSRADSLSDTLAAYKIDTDNYRNALSRVEDVRTLKGDNVLMDPLKAMHLQARQIASTTAGSQFEKAFREKFVKDFNDVIPGDDFPTSLDQISVRAKSKPASPELSKLEKSARAAWRRHDNFVAAREVNVFDRAWFNSLQSMGDFLERFRLKQAPDVARKLSQMGLTGISAQGKALATRLMITYVLPIRHWVIQPMMFFEQAAIFPRTAVSSFKRSPLLVQELLGIDVSLQKKAMLKSKKELLEYDLELKALKETNVLESINQNLAAHEVLGRRISSFDEGMTPFTKLGRKAQSAEAGVAAVFNKVGFASGELLNRVGMFLQNKERWKYANQGKDWTTKTTVKDFAQSSWEQSGAMTRAGALAFQRQPVLSFLTQFLAINVKGLVNILQDNATNLTRAERARLTGARVLIHGVKYGTFGGLGNLIYEYFANHPDPNVQQNAELLQKGFLDFTIQAVSELVMDEESDVSFSESASINATNAPLEVLTGLFQTLSFLKGDRSAQAPNIPFNTAVGRIMESISKAEDIFKYRELTGDDMFDVMGALLEMTSAGSNIAKARRAWRMHELYTKNGYAKGLEVTTSDAFWQMFGFRTYKEAELRRGEELKRSRESRIKDEIESLDSVFVNVFTGTRASAETKFGLLNDEINLLRNSGEFTGSELNDIYAEVLRRQGSRAQTTRAGSLFTYILNTDGQGEDLQAIMNILKNVKDKDPVLQDYYNLIVNRNLTNLKE